MNFNDEKSAALVRSGYEGSIGDMETEYLQTLTGDTELGNRNDLWNLYLDQQLIPEGDLNDRKYEFFGLHGGIADQINEREIQYWQGLP